MLSAIYLLSLPLLYQTYTRNKKGNSEGIYPQLSMTVPKIFCHKVGNTRSEFFANATTIVKSLPPPKIVVDSKFDLFLSNFFLQSLSDPPKLPAKHSAFIISASVESTPTSECKISVSHSLPVTFQ